jgi:Cu(I)/Ag(I) efflux system membrane fusion protein
LQTAGDVRNPYYGSKMLSCFDKREAMPITGAGAASLKASPANEPATQPALAPANAQSQVDAVVKAYLQLHEVLIEEPVELRAAVEPLKQIHAAANQLAEQLQGHPGILARDLASSSHHAPGSTEALREAFGKLSGDLVELVKLVPPTAQATPQLYQAYCPMVKKDWLQAGNAVANPFDPSMPTCGTIKQQIAVAGQARE